MSHQPNVIMLHSVHASRAHDEHQERDLLEDYLGFDIPLAQTPPESRALIAEADIVLCDGITAQLIDEAEQLEWIQAFSSGISDYPLESIQKEGIYLTNAAGIHAEPIAEQVIGYMLIFSRQLNQGLRQQSQPRWERYEGDELKGKTIGIIGVGSIGRRLAEICEAFDMKILGIKNNPETSLSAVDEVYGSEELFQVLCRSDYVVIACPLTEETEGMIGDDEIKSMKNSAVLINIARGPIVDYDRLLVALQQHEISGAALDVFPKEPYQLDSPLWELPNVIMTPHMGGSTPKKAPRICEVFKQNYQEFINENFTGMPTRVV